MLAIMTRCGRGFSEPERSPPTWSTKSHLEGESYTTPRPIDSRFLPIRASSIRRKSFERSLRSCTCRRPPGWEQTTITDVLVVYALSPSRPGQPRRRKRLSSTAMPRRHRRRRSDRRTLAELDRAVGRQRPARVVRDFPHVALGVGECARIAAPVGAGGRTSDRPPGALRLGEQGIDLLG